MDAADSVLAEERRALDYWAQGEPSGYVNRWASDVTYFDDIGAHRRLDGHAAIRQYFQSLTGKIPAHRYAVVDPKVQLYGDVAVLTLRYEPSTADGQRLTTWKATCVYHRVGDDWRVVHAHWSMVKES